jgi:hypothetical protein
MCNPTAVLVPTGRAALRRFRAVPTYQRFHVCTQLVLLGEGYADDPDGSRLFWAIESCFASASIRIYAATRAEAICSNDMKRRLS